MLHDGLIRSMPQPTWRPVQQLRWLHGPRVDVMRSPVSMSEARANLTFMDEKRFEHWCEACGATATLTSEEAFQAGWDFPPRMDAWGVVSPRSCGNCTINRTLWWALTVEKKDIDSCTPHQRKVLARILDEMPDYALDAQ